MALHRGLFLSRAAGFPFNVVALQNRDTSVTHEYPAVVLVRPKTAGLKIAALTLLDRLIVALHRGGCARITLVTCEPLPPLRRSRAWGILFDVVSERPPVAGPVLVATTDQLVLATDVRELLTRGGRLESSDGRGMPIGIFRNGLAGDEPDFGTLPSLRASAAACAVADARDLPAASQRLWASLTSSSDGFVDRWFNRPLGRPLARWLVRTPVTPNLISLVSIAIGVAAAWFFAQGAGSSAILGAILFQVSAIIDCVDGDVARAVFKESPWGRWLDIVGDQVVHAAVFGGIALGLYRMGNDTLVLWLGASAMAGALIAFGVVMRGLRQGEREGSALQRLIDATTNRDFSVLVLGLAVAEELTWFLWMAAIGSHLFWIATLALQWRKPQRESSAA